VRADIDRLIDGFGRERQRFTQLRRNCTGMQATGTTGRLRPTPFRQRRVRRSNGRHARAVERHARSTNGAVSSIARHTPPAGNPTRHVGPARSYGTAPF
jgi:hypothetical protein